MANSKVYSNTWKGVKEAARNAGAKFPELVAAQWALESGFGKATSGRNNYFGLKGKGSDCETHEYVNGKKIIIRDGFLDFEDMGSCVSYLVSRWYMDWQGYKGVNNADTREEAAEKLEEEGYATDPGYSDKLITLMNEYEERKYSSKNAGKKKILFNIRATQDTWLKKSTANADTLSKTEKVLVKKGFGYAVTAYRELAKDGHADITLAYDAGTWYVFEPHWMRMQPISEQDSSEIDWNNFNAQVTSNLTVGEILQWDKRRIPPEGHLVRAQLVRTAKAFQEIRDAWGGPLGVTSFYRPEPVNSEVGGVRNSKHVTGEAFDIYPVGRSLDDFYQWIRRRWTGGLGDGRNQGFVHVDLRGNGRFVPGAGVLPKVEWLY